MPAQAFKVRDKVQNVRPSSQYYGQVGNVTSIQNSGENARYVVTWPSGESMTYRAASLTPALVPEKSFLVSDSGFRKTGNSSKRTTKHTVPASNRPALV